MLDQFKQRSNVSQTRFNNNDDNDDDNNIQFFPDIKSLLEMKWSQNIQDTTEPTCMSEKLISTTCTNNLHVCFSAHLGS